MLSISKRRIAPIAALVLVLVSCKCLLSQTDGAAKSSRDKVANRDPNAESRWRLNATDIQLQKDDVDSSIRASRNAFWRPVLQARRDLENKGVTTYASGGFYPYQYMSEIADTPNSVWLIAKFDHYHVISIDPQYQLLYTEESFNVVRVIRQPSKGSLAAGAVFAIDHAGGTILTPQGDTVTWGFEPYLYSEQPGHTYLMQLTQGSANQFLVGKYWDVTTGRLVAEEPDDYARAAAGKSKLIGLSVSDAVKYLASMLIQDSDK